MTSSALTKICGMFSFSITQANHSIESVEEITTCMIGYLQSPCLDNMFFLDHVIYYLIHPITWHS